MELFLKIDGKRIQLEPKQKEFCDWDKPWRFRYWQGGFGAMKSTTIMVAVIELCWLFPKNRWLVARKNFTDLEKSTIQTFFNICPKESIKSYNKASHECVFVNDSQIYFTGAEDYHKFRSMEIGGFAIDEASETEKNMFYLLVSRIGRLPHVPPEWNYGLLASNPPNADHWLHELFVEGKEENEFKHWESSARENKPLLKKNPNYVKDLEKIYGHDPQLVDVYIDGKFGFALGGRRVHPEFNPRLHIENVNYVPGKVVYRTWDFGRIHPAVLWSQSDYDGRIIHLNEDMGRDIHFPRYRDHIIERSNFLYPESDFMDFCDDSGNNKTGDAEKSYVEWLREKGIRPRHKRLVFEKARDIIAQKLTTLIDGKPSLLISPRCNTLIEGMKGGFRYPETKDGKAEREYPLQDGYYEHLCDCNLMLNFNMFSYGFKSKQFKQPNYGLTYGNRVVWM